MTAPISAHGFRLGRLPSSPRHLARLLRAEHYIDFARLLPLIPASYHPPKSYVAPMYLNDKEGDCTAAAAAHIEDQNALEESGAEIGFRDSQVDAFYRLCSGGPDVGADMGTCLKNWQAVGIGGQRILAYAALRPGDLRQLRAVIWLFRGGAYIAGGLPDRVVPDGEDWGAIPWTGSAVPNPNNGHCVSCPGFDPGDLFDVATWGQKAHPMDGAFYADVFDEPYLVVTAALVAQGGLDPDHFDLQTLLEDVGELTGTQPPAPPPQPPQPPTPGPTPGPNGGGCFGLARHALEIAAGMPH